MSLSSIGDDVKQIAIKRNDNSLRKRAVLVEKETNKPVCKSIWLCVRLWCVGITHATIRHYIYLHFVHAKIKLSVGRNSANRTSIKLCYVIFGDSITRSSIDARRVHGQIHYHFCSRRRQGTTARTATHTQLVTTAKVKENDKSEAHRRRKKNSLEIDLRTYENNETKQLACSEIWLNHNNITCNAPRTPFMPCGEMWREREKSYAREKKLSQSGIIVRHPPISALKRQHRTSKSE